MAERKLWFAAKRYGWGWRPVTWQGWLVVLAYTCITLGASILSTTLPLLMLAIIGLATLLLLWICYRTGESPRWRWGKD